jgi:hypothetical protein
MENNLYGKDRVKNEIISTYAFSVTVENHENAQDILCPAEIRTQHALNSPQRYRLSSLPGLQGYGHQTLKPKKLFSFKEFSLLPSTKEHISIGKKITH